MLKNKRIIKIIALLTVLIMSMSILTGCGEKESNKKESNDKETSDVKDDGSKEASAAYEQPIKYLVEGLEQTSAKTFLKAFPPFLGDMMDGIFTDEYLSSIIEESLEEFGDNIKMTYKVTDKEELTDEDLKEMEEEVKESFGEEIDITKGYEVKVELTTKGDDSEKTEKDSFEVFEIDGNWYVLDF